MSFSELLKELFSDPVEMPDHASRQSISAAIACGLHAIERETERRRQEELNRPQSPHDDNIGIRYKTRQTGKLSLVQQFLVPEGRCPPDLKATVLTFSAQLLTFVREKCDGRGVIAYKRSGIARNVYSRVISNNWSHVNKRTALQFCIGLQLSREEADILLKSAGYALSETIVEDCIFAYCIEHRIWNLEGINEILAKCGLETIQINKEKQ